MPRRTDLLDHLRAEGLTVVETNGWKTRGSETFNPTGSVNHHTAGAATGDAPSLNLVINGRTDLSGPLCNVLQSRKRDANGLDVVYLVAAGRANHAGTGGWQGLSGNSRVFGLEIEHVGTTAESFSPERAATAVRVHTAFARCTGFDPKFTCQHWEWTTRKQDFVKAELDPNGFRSSINARLHPSTPPSQENDVFEYRIVSIPAANDQGHQWQGHDVTGKDLGVFHNDCTVTIKANDNGVPVLANVQPYAFNGMLALSFFGLDGKVAPQGNVGVVIGHPLR